MRGLSYHEFARLSLPTANRTSQWAPGPASTSQDNSSRSETPAAVKAKQNCPTNQTQTCLQRANQPIYLHMVAMFLNCLDTHDVYEASENLHEPVEIGGHARSNATKQRMTHAPTNHSLHLSSNEMLVTVADWLLPIITLFAKIF